MSLETFANHTINRLSKYSSLLPLASQLCNYVWVNLAKLSMKVTFAADTWREKVS